MESPVSKYTSIGVLIRQDFCCKLCTTRIGLATSWYKNVIPIDDPYWTRSKTPLCHRKSPLRAYCAECKPERSRRRRTSLGS